MFESVYWLAFVRDIAVSYYPEIESAGVYFNDASARVSSINYWGELDRGQLARVEKGEGLDPLVCLQKNRGQPPVFFACLWINRGLSQV